MRYFFTVLLTIITLSTINAQYRKMSPLVRQAAKEGSTMPALAKGGSTMGSPRLIAFVRTTDKEAVTRQGCDILLDLDNIIIASIPLQNIEAVAALPQVQRIDAKQSDMQVLNDIAASTTLADKLWTTPTQTLPGYTGKDVVVGVIDAEIDFTHPTFKTSDGQQLRIKAAWDWLDFTDNGSEVSFSPLIGRQFIGEGQIMQKKCSADSQTSIDQGHGTHTSATAAGSGYNGSTVTKYIGMAPEADLCMVTVTTGSNTEMIPEDRKYAYTDATNILAFKYIFDYAESQGKPCVINISMGSCEDLYESYIKNEAISKLVGPGRIICAAAGNTGNRNTYIHKTLGKERAGAFLSFQSETYNTWLLSSTDYPMVNLTFYPQNEEKIEWHYDTNALRQTPDESHFDSLEINGKKVYMEIFAYPSWVDSTQCATDILIMNEEGMKLGSSIPVALTLTDADNDIEAFAQVGFFTASSKDSSLKDYDKTHNINIPAACDDVIGVGSASYRPYYINYRGGTASWYSDTDGKRSAYSSIGPNKRGNIKPEVMASGQNVISAMNSYFYETLKESNSYRQYVVETFDSDGRTYGWYGMSGTSMSAPVVTGIVALWLQENPNLTPDDIREVIANTSRQEVSGLEYPNNEYGYGAIDAVAGMNYIKEHFPTPTPYITTAATPSTNTYYDINGRRMSSINGHHGIFIVTKDGKTRKVVQ